MLDFVHAQHQKGGLRRLHLACNCKKIYFNNPQYLGEKAFQMNESIPRALSRNQASSKIHIQASNLKLEKD